MMRKKTSTRDNAMMGSMNTTPLIDVMLVLLIMFIITIPVQTHSVDLDIGDGPPPEFPVLAVRNTIGVAPDNAVSWNGAPVSDRELRALMVAAASHPDRPELHLRPHEHARYERVDQLLADARKAGTTKLGFVGNERHSAAF